MWYVGKGVGGLVEEGDQYEERKKRESERKKLVTKRFRKDDGKDKVARESVENNNRDQITLTIH